MKSATILHLIIHSNASLKWILILIYSVSFLLVDRYQTAVIISIEWIKEKDRESFFQISRTHNCNNGIIYSGKNIITNVHPLCMWSRLLLFIEIQIIWNISQNERQGNNIFRLLSWQKKKLKCEHAWMQLMKIYL